MKRFGTSNEMTVRKVESTILVASARRVAIAKRRLVLLYSCCTFLFLSVMSKTVVDASPIFHKHQQSDGENNGNNSYKAFYQLEPAFDAQSWIFEMINLFDAWEMGFTGEGIKVRINDENWESGHFEWNRANDISRIIDKNYNAENGYSCGDPDNALPITPDGTERAPYLNHGAAVTSILAADGSNDFCGVGIAPRTLLSFCNFRKDTNPSILSFDVTDSHNRFDISVNSFAYDGCKPAVTPPSTTLSFAPEDDGEQTIATGFSGTRTRTANFERSIRKQQQQQHQQQQHQQQQQQSHQHRESMITPIEKSHGQHQHQRQRQRHLQQGEEIQLCPFVNFAEDEYNQASDDPCKVCTKSDFDSVRFSNENGRNVATSITRSEGGGSPTITTATGVVVSETCATSVQTYCSRNFLRDEILCTEWIDVLQRNGSACRFQNGVGELADKAMEKGVKDGRDGRGVVYIFSAGNSYAAGDNSNFQSFAKSRYAMTVGAVKVKEVSVPEQDSDGNENADSARLVKRPIHASYSTGGSSIFVVAPGGDYDTPSYQHVGAGGTEGSGESCVTIGIGTSFAAPVVGGVVALMLDANPFLTWRDVRYIIAETSNPISRYWDGGDDDEIDTTYGVNAAGVGYSDLYGFGLIDATKAVTMAVTWGTTQSHVQPEVSITAQSGRANLEIADDPSVTTTSSITIDPSQNPSSRYSRHEDHALESVSVYLKLHYPNRGQLRITLTSPQGTVSLLTPGRRSEHTHLEDNEWWEFLTLRSWGENPYGEWKLTITDTKQGNGGVTCFDRQLHIAPEFTNLNVPLTCTEFKSNGFCANGQVNEEVVNEQENVYATLFENGYGDNSLTGREACCECGGGIRSDSDDFFRGTLKEWKIIFGDGTTSTGTKRIENYDPFLPQVTSYEFMRCRGENIYGEKRDCCNGNEYICDLRVNEVMFATLHNGLNLFKAGVFVELHKEFKIERALEAGYRAFNIDICNCEGALFFCYDSCAKETRRDVIELMMKFKEFLELNPTEVVVFFFDLTHYIDQPVIFQDFFLLLRQIKGLVDMIYTHDAPTSSWPTLRQLTDPSYNKRMIMFHYNGPICEDDPLRCVSQIHSYYDYVMDNNNRTYLDPREIEDRESSCVLRRPDSYNENALAGLTNFVTPIGWKERDRLQNEADAGRLNQYYALKDYVKKCSISQGTDINFVSIDWWGTGELLRLTQDHNSIRALGDGYVPPTPAPTFMNEITEAPTLFPTFFPTEEPETFPPTVSPQPSFSPTNTPTGRPDICTEFDGDCRACKKNVEECLWCVSSNSCYNRFVFENIFDMDDEVIPCAGEDILNSFDTGCKASSGPFGSVYDDDFENWNESNETSADEVDEEIEEEIDSTSPTVQPAEPPTLPPIYVPLSPPTAVESTKNIFNEWFGGGDGGDSSGASSLAFVTNTTAPLFIMMFLLLEM